jgi:Putative phage serine protease XkdF
MGLKLTDDEFNFFAGLVGEQIPDMRSVVGKGRGYDFRTVHQIRKISPERQNVFGWASVGYLPEGGSYHEYTDWQGDVLKKVEDIEDAAYDFTLHARDQGTDHVGSGGKGSLIESFVSTPEKWDAMGIPSGVLPIAWWTGFHIQDPVAWDGVKKGKYKMFSVQGTGRRIPL